MEEKVWTAKEFERFKEQRRCMRCKKRTFDDLIICHKCQEFQYCSIECLEADRAGHHEACSLIGLKKGRVQLFEGDEARRIDDIVNRARLLDDEGNIRIKPQPPEANVGSDEGEAQGLAQESVQGLEASRTPGGKKKRKKKRSKRGHSKKQGDTKDVVQDLEITQASKKEEPSVDALVAGGRFGGPARCDSKVRSGTSFGEGWFQPWKKETKSSSEQIHGKPTSVNPKSTQLYSDSDDDLKDSESKRSQDVRGSASSSSTAAAAAAASVSGASASLEEAMTGLELVKYDAKKAEEETERSRNEGGGSAAAATGTCAYCKKEGNVLKCSRCFSIKYCSKECQKRHFAQHKDLCKRIERFGIALSRAQPALNLLAAFGMDSAENVSPVLRDLPDPLTHMVFGASHTILLEIIGPYPHFFRHGAYVRDAAGQITHVMFYDECGIYRHIGAGLFGIPLPIPLSRCLRPGNFILLLDAHWHRFLDGTIGIRIDDLDLVHFVFMPD